MTTAIEIMVRSYFEDLERKGVFAPEIVDKAQDRLLEKYGTVEVSPLVAIHEMISIKAGK